MPHNFSKQKEGDIIVLVKHNWLFWFAQTRRKLLQIITISREKRRSRPVNSLDIKSSFQLSFRSLFDNEKIKHKIQIYKEICFEQNNKSDKSFSYTHSYLSILLFRLYVISKICLWTLFGWFTLSSIFNTLPHKFYLPWRKVGNIHTKSFTVLIEGRFRSTSTF